MHYKYPNNFYFLKSFKKNNIDKLDNNTGVIYRNYKKNLDINEILSIKKYCTKRNIKFFLSNNFKTAINLGLDGAYIPSFNRDFRHLNYMTNSSFIILGSAHNLKEIRIKEIQKVELIFISSIFKKNKNYKGIYNFRCIKKITDKKVVALGGITKLNKRKLKLVDCFGYSGISYFE